MEYKIGTVEIMLKTMGNKLAYEREWVRELLEKRIVYRANLSFNKLLNRFKLFTEKLFSTNTIYRYETNRNIKYWKTFKGFNPNAKTCVRRMCCSKIPYFVVSLKSLPFHHPLYYYVVPNDANIYKYLRKGLMYDFEFTRLTNYYYLCFDAGKLVENGLEVYPAYYVHSKPLTDYIEYAKRYALFKYFHPETPLVWYELEFFTVNYVPIDLVDRVYTDSSRVAKVFEELGVKVASSRDLQKEILSQLGKSWLRLYTLIWYVFRVNKLAETNPMMGKILSDTEMKLMLNIYNISANKWLRKIGVELSEKHYPIF